MAHSTRLMERMRAETASFAANDLAMSCLLRNRTGAPMPAPVQAALRRRFARSA